MSIGVYRVKPGAKVNLARWDPEDRSLIRKSKAAAHARLEKLTRKLDQQQELLYAQGRHKLLVVLQAMDTAGKDSTIRYVFEGVNPQGVRVAGFRAPTQEELARDFLWRVHDKVPGRGEIVIFNRSHYEDVLITRVNGWIDSKTCRARYQQINAFEKLLADTGTTILKFYLHISKDEQEKRLLERRDDPTKQWKFNPADLKARDQWEDYMRAYAAALSATSTDHAPWYVAPANSKLQRNLIIAQTITDALAELKMRYPPALPEVKYTLIK
jgi:PPK2 family polyphosphate:nucleotide phosphotransferase